MLWSEARGQRLLQRDCDLHVGTQQPRLDRVRVQDAEGNAASFPWRVGRSAPDTAPILSHCAAESRGPSPSGRAIRMFGRRTEPFIASGEGGASPKTLSVAVSGARAQRVSSRCPRSRSLPPKRFECRAKATRRETALSGPLDPFGSRGGRLAGHDSTEICGLFGHRGGCEPPQGWPR